MTEEPREVEEAKALMAEAMGWSVMKWLREKKAVRKVADQANAVLDTLGDKVKERWPEDFKAAYASLSPSEPRTTANGKNPQSQVAHAEDLLTAKQIRHADDEAYRARMDAEETFDAAERQLSTRLARQGCEKAIRAWELKAKAINKAEVILKK